MRSVRRSALLLLALAACAMPPRLSSVSGGDARSDLPPGWADVTTSEFETLARGFGPLELSADDLATLERSLSSPTTESLRATILLTRSRDLDAREAILHRLEQRVLGPSRESDAGDVVGAAALADWNLAPSDVERLLPLATGDRPHPDVEVRTEIACVLLAAGRDEVVPFLLTILREGTLDQADRVAWERKPQMAWAKGRAAQALSRRAGVPLAYEADGSFADQAREATRLEERVRDSSERAR